MTGPDEPEPIFGVHRNHRPILYGVVSNLGFIGLLIFIAALLLWQIIVVLIRS